MHIKRIQKENVMELLQNECLLQAILVLRRTDHIHCLQVGHQHFQVDLNMQMVIWVLQCHRHHSAMALCNMDKCLPPSLHNRRVAHFHHQCRDLDHLHHGRINPSSRDKECLHQGVCLISSSSDHHQDHLHPTCHHHRHKVSLEGHLLLWVWGLRLAGQGDHHHPPKV